MYQILPGLFGFTGLIAGRVYAIEDPDGLTLIDASLANSPPKIVRQLEAAGRRASDVKRILITHAHPDHVGGLAALQAATGAQVYASAGERPVIEGEIPIPTPPPEAISGISRFLRPPDTFVKPTKVARVVGHAEVLDEVMGGLQVISTPGHAPGHLAFWHPERRIIFCGDVIMRLRGLSLPFSFVTVDMAENKRSIARVVELQPSVVCFGHGDPLTEQAPSKLAAFAKEVGAS